MKIGGYLPQVGPADSASEDRLCCERSGPP